MTTHDDSQDRKNDEQLDLDDFDDAFSPVLEDTEAEDAEADPTSTPAAAQHAEPRAEDSAAVPITDGVDVPPPGQELAEAFRQPGLPDAPSQEATSSETPRLAGVPDTPSREATDLEPPRHAGDYRTLPPEEEEPRLPGRIPSSPPPQEQPPPTDPPVVVPPRSSGTEAPPAKQLGLGRWIPTGVAVLALAVALFALWHRGNGPEASRPSNEIAAAGQNGSGLVLNDGSGGDAVTENGTQAETVSTDSAKPPPPAVSPMESNDTDTTSVAVSMPFDAILDEVSKLKSSLEDGIKERKIDIATIRKAMNSLDNLLNRALIEDSLDESISALRQADEWEKLLPELHGVAENNQELNNAVQQLSQAIRNIKRYCGPPDQSAGNLDSFRPLRASDLQSVWMRISGPVSLVGCLLAPTDLRHICVGGVVQDISLPPAAGEAAPETPSTTSDFEAPTRQLCDEMWKVLGEAAAYDRTPPSSIGSFDGSDTDNIEARNWDNSWKTFSDPRSLPIRQVVAARELAKACQADDPKRALLQFCLPGIQRATQYRDELAPEEREHAQRHLNELLQLRDNLEKQVLAQLKPSLRLPADAAERLNKLQEIENTIAELKAAPAPMPSQAHEERISKLEQRLPSPSDLADQLRMLGLPGSLDSRQPVLPPQASDEERQEHEHWAKLWDVARQDCTRLQELAAQPERLSARDTADAQVRLHRVTAVLLDLQNHRGAVQVAGRVPMARSRVAEFLQRIESRLQETAAADATQSAPASVLQKRAEQNIAAIRAALADEPEAAESLSANAARIVQASLSELLADYAELQLLRVSPDAPLVTRESALTFLALLGFPDLDDEVEFGVRLAELQPASEDAASLWAALQADLAAMKNLLGGQVAWTDSQSREVNDLLRNISYAVLRLETPAAQDHAQPLVWSRKVGLLGRRVRYYYAYPGSLVPPIQLAQALRNTQSELLAMIGDRSAEAQRLAEQTAASLQRTQGELSQTRSDLGHVEEQVRETASRLAAVSAALTQPRELPSAQIEQIGENIESRLLDRLAAHGYPPQKVPAPVPRTEASPGIEDTQPPLPTPVRPGPSSPASRMHAAEIYAAGRAAFFSESNQGLARATRLFSQSVDLDPDNPIYRYYLGLTLYRQGRYQEALEQVQSGASLESTETYRRGSLGALERIQGPLRVWLERVRLETHALAGSRRTSDDQQPRG